MVSKKHKRLQNQQRAIYDASCLEIPTHKVFVESKEVDKIALSVFGDYVWLMEDHLND